ncbi:NHL domain-containing protein [Edaphobacter albus]|uniref:NHL domain-containing protein n=1 Tax=Edaphobacter sp. 4G125 TaxID=2763071 RepID=UPI001647C0BF|nr:Ig-like domain repeat protein [Edaphobacter sp. 4G125]QNI37759.1 Ig-like domain repeat protein [Edaphobacter sp. 4G125]
MRFSALWFSVEVFFACIRKNNLLRKLQTAPRLSLWTGLALFLLVGTTTRSAQAQVTQLPMWVQLNPVNAPSPRGSAAVAYDAAHNQVVLFGGTDNSVLGDTWVWDGTNWTQKSPTNSPPARMGATMAYDAAHSQVVLFGGSANNNGNNLLADTWTWDGTNWTQQAPATSPAPVAYASMAYDAAHSQVVLFGGRDTSYAETNNTWTWNGSNWTQQTPVNSPSARYAATMAYDVAHSQVVLFGGTVSSNRPSDTWTWDGTNWTQQTPANSPTGGTYYIAMAYDAAHNQTVLFGGFTGNNATWAWDGTNWTQQSQTNAPSGRTALSMAYDAAHSQVILFGGFSSSSAVNDTWAWKSGAQNMGTANVCLAGATAPAPCSQQITVNYQVTSGTTIGAVKVVTQGATGLDFNPTPNDSSTTLCKVQTYNTTTMCTVDVTFTPRYPGQRLGAIIIQDSSGNALATTNLYGSGTGPQVGFTPGTITTIAGNGTRGYSGDNNPATSAQLSLPGSVSADGSGNLYIADYGNNLIRKVDATTGIITTVAGNGSAGYSGDHGPAIAAQLNNPIRVSVDGAGNFYIADVGNSRIRKVDATTGIITTAADNLAIPNDVVADGSGNLYIAESLNRRIRKVDAATGIITTVAGNSSSGYSGDNGPATSAQLNYPNAVAVDGAGNLYISDYGNSRIRKVDAATGIITTVAGNGTLGYSGDNGPATSAQLRTSVGVSIDNASNLYIAEAGNNRIRKVDATGIITTIAGNGSSGYGGDNGPATSAQLNNPNSIFVDGAGNLYIADFGNDRIRKVDVSTARLNFPQTGVDATSSSQSITVSNLGNQDLTFPTPSTGSNPGVASGFAIDTSSNTTCPLVYSTSAPGTLTAGSSCTLAAQFAPHSAGNFTGAVTLWDNALNAAAPGYATQSISLSGTATQGTQTISFTAPSTAAYGDAPITLSATTSSGLTVSFSVVSGPATLSGSTLTITGAGTIVVAADQPGDTNYNAAPQITQSITVNPVPLTVTASNATRVYGAANPTLTATVTGTILGDVFTPVATTTATTTSSTGTYPIVPTVTGPNLSNYNVTYGNGILTISKAGATIILSTNVGTIFAGQPVTLVTTVASTTSGVPTGSVNFLDGTTLLGTVTLSAGQATLSTTALAVGAHNITAVYSGDTNFAPATTITTPTITIASPDFSLNGGGGSQSVIPGNAATFSFGVTPASGTFSAPVTFIASGLPAGATATFNPSGFPTGSAGGQVQMTIQTAKLSATAKLPRSSSKLALALLLFPFLGVRNVRRRIGRAGVLIVLLAISAAGVSGCGSDTGIFAQNPKDYAVTVTVTSGSVQRTMNYTLNLQ